jgi:hypothetical protein
MAMSQAHHTNPARPRPPNDPPQPGPRKPAPPWLHTLWIVGLGSRAYADETQKVIDEEVADLLREAEQRALALLTEHRAALDRLVQELIAHETVDGATVDAAIHMTVDATAVA